MASRVVVDARALQLPMTGIGHYVSRLLRELPPGMTGVARPSAPVEPAGLAVRQLRPDLWNVLWNDVCVRRALRDADAFWATVGYVPWRRTPGCRIVATIHDVIHHTNPVGLSVQRRLDLENAVRASVRRADILTTTGQHVSEQLAAHYGRAADLFIEPAPTIVAATAEAATAMRARLAAAHPQVERWVLAVGTEIARKNFVRIAEAVATVPGAGLVIAGPPGDASVGEALQALAARAPIVRLGYTDNADLAALYAGTDVLAYVSLLEGYGMPLLDARAVGQRIVVSAEAPLPEHAGPSATVVDAHSVESIAAGIKRCLDAPPPPPEQLPTWADSAAKLRTALGLPS
ncbi:MAG: glycosyltransferase family 4 protein [Actinomycetes bacterium]